MVFCIVSDHIVNHVLCIALVFPYWMSRVERGRRRLESDSERAHRARARLRVRLGYPRRWGRGEGGQGRSERGTLPTLTMTPPNTNNNCMKRTPPPPQGAAVMSQIGQSVKTLPGRPPAPLALTRPVCPTSLLRLSLLRLPYPES